MIIGITGKSCSGKNYIAKDFARKGFEVWDLDKEAQKIRREKRTQVMAAFGTTDSQELRAIVFSDPVKRKQLEDIIYPELIEKIKAYKYDLVINGATLKRAGLDKICSKIIYVDCPYEERLRRAKKRDAISEEEFAKREASQDDIDYKKNAYCCPVEVIENI